MYIYVRFAEYAAINKFWLLAPSETTNLDTRGELFGSI